VIGLRSDLSRHRQYRSGWWSTPTSASRWPRKCDFGRQGGWRCWPGGERSRSFDQAPRRIARETTLVCLRGRASALLQSRARTRHAARMGRGGSPRRARGRDGGSVRRGGARAGSLRGDRITGTAKGHRGCFGPWSRAQRIDSNLPDAM